MFAHGEHFDISDDDHLIVIFVENSIVQNIFESFVVSLGEEQHGLCRSIGCLEKAWSAEILSNAAKDAAVGVRQFLHKLTVPAAATGVHILYGRIHETAATAGTRRRFPRLEMRMRFAMFLFSDAVAAADSEFVKDVLFMITVDFEVNRRGIV